MSITKNIPEINAFCRKYDLIFVEDGMIDHKPIMWFINFNNRRIPFSEDEVSQRLRQDSILVLAPK